MTHAVHLSDDLFIRSIDADLSFDQRLTRSITWPPASLAGSAVRSGRNR